jgi:NAD(P)-dependent dehydrogenase (short-subunit alcohol dehydrogenase family)
VTNIVIGAGSGMGAAVAEILAPRGKLLLADINLAAVKHVAEGIGGDVEVMACDMTNQAQVDALVSCIDDLASIVVTAAISASMGPGRRILEVNLRGVERVMSAVRPLIRAGSVGVCFSSTGAYAINAADALVRVLDDPLTDDFFTQFAAHGGEADDPHLAYATSKLGIRRMVARLAPIWGAKGARIMCLSPGINDTPMNRLDESNHPIMAELIKSSPLGRRGTPVEIANVVDFLTSDKASYMTGSEVLVDGGLVQVLLQRLHST